jgi:hypothetical protein
LQKADALRRAHRLDEAALLYRKIATQPDGTALAEESLLRAALALAELRRTQEAIDVLRDARARFDGGELVPERTALEARLLLAAGRPLDAATRLLAAPSPAKENLELRTRRVEVAEALCTSAPDTARRVLAPVFDAHLTPTLTRRARAAEACIRQKAEAQIP